MNFKKENWPFYVMLCLMFLSFCKVNPIPFEKDYITAITNGFFILGGIYLTSALASKELDKKWNKKYYDVKEIYELEECLYSKKQLLEITTQNSFRCKGLPSTQHNSKYSLREQYNKLVTEYRIRIESSDFISGHSHEPIYKYCKSVDGEKPEYCDELKG